ncbi:MAG: DUF4124 domain-containing protein, partial [Burkholderiaceae bacterium]|nr:DUF4124 domain-containing protein [Burkholderiaceae bacterium]
MVCRAPFIIALLWLPALVGAQAFKCTDPGTGKALYTDQPCKGGQLVVPQRTEAEIRRDAEAAALARENAFLRREQIALERERLRQAERPAVAQAQQSAATSEACREARAEAAVSAGNPAAAEEQIRTARYNAALACGQQPPPDIVVTPQPYLP